MEEERGIKKICCYLPYKVWAKSVSGSYEFVIHGISESENEATPVVLDGLLDEFGFSEFKLKLVPLSKLTKDEKFIDLINEELICGAWKFEEDDRITSIVTTDGSYYLIAFSNEIAIDCPYMIYKYLVENHYDIHNLIEQGQAIDKTK